ncbi:SOS response-associated peptidase [Marinobacter sp.]|uniref:SOS response-associated peptidase n=1 Tax=Marinobacter sp. TaxID=50741 RepID=UPI00384BD3E8
MCGRYALYEPVDQVAQRIGYPVRSSESLPGNGYNIPPGGFIVAVAAVDEKPEILPMWWGFRPHWAGEDAPEPINARAENVAGSNFFKGSFARHRCIIPANGWFEWRQNNGDKQPFYIHHRDGDLLLMAGIFTTDEDGNPACCILTEDARGPAKDIHPRMPVVLGEGVEIWLDPETHDRETLKRKVKHLSPDRLCFRPVSARVNNPRNDDEDVLKEVS